MEKRQLLSYLEQPETLTGESIPELETLVGCYPFFSIGQSLLTLAYHNGNDARYDQQLKKAAGAVPDRNRLRLLFIHAKRQPTAPDDSFFRFVESSEITGNDKEVIPEKMFIIPEINLSGSHEELSAEL